MAVGAIYHFSTSISLSLLSYKLQNIRVALFLYSIEGGFWTVPTPLFLPSNVEINIFISNTN
jgi:hypothetical protein